MAKLSQPKDTFKTNKQLYLAKDPDRYKARKLVTLLRLMDQKLSLDPASIDPVKYIRVLDEYKLMCEAIARKKRKDGVDEELVAGEAKTGKTGPRKKTPFSLDT